jgi:hypothetical protein
MVEKGNKEGEGIQSSILCLDRGLKIHVEFVCLNVRVSGSLVCLNPAGGLIPPIRRRHTSLCMSSMVFRLSKPWKSKSPRRSDHLKHLEEMFAFGQRTETPVVDV